MEQVAKPLTRKVRLELAALEVRLLECLILHDVDSLEHHIGEEFSLTTGRPGAETRSRAEWLWVAREEYVLESFAIDEVAVQEYGDVAVVRMRYRQAGRMGGADRTGAYRMTDVFVRRDGRWQLVARHATQVPDSRAADHSSSSLAQPQPQA